MEFSQIKYQDPATQTYLGSPSLVRLASGEILATHDYFGPGAPLNHDNEEHLTSVYRSRNDGHTWSEITHLSGAFWSSLFLHHGSLYLLGTSQQYGSIVIRRSEDGGNTWTHPTDERTGLLFRGGPRRTPPNYHCAPMPVLLAGGRLYRAFEDADPCDWPTGFQALVISADEDADLLDADSWEMSNKLAYDPDWTPAAWGKAQRPGWLEGNIVQTPDGELWDILRFNSAPAVDKAAVVRVHDRGRRISFDPATGFIDLPGGMSKFSIRRDPVSGLYVSLVNNNTHPYWPAQRNVLSLYTSPDLLQWTHRQTLLRTYPRIHNQRTGPSVLAARKQMKAHAKCSNAR